MTDVAKETTMTMTDAGREAIKKLLCCLLKAYSSSIRSTFGLAGESPRAAEIRDRLNRGLHAAVDELTHANRDAIDMLNSDPSTHGG